MKRLLISIALLSLLSGCEYKVRCVEDVQLEISYIKTPKHFRVYAKEVLNNDTLDSKQHLIYSSKHCSKILHKVGDKLIGEKVYKQDGSYTINSKQTKFCG